MHDINSNGTIDIEDFLSILGLFADVDVDGDGVWDSQDDCLDAAACNYLASPTESCTYLDALGECGGACEGDGDGDGICDDTDYCIGLVDECGVCNGPGPLEYVIESISIQYDSIWVDQIEEWLTFEVGADTVFSYICPPFVCGSLVSYQGYDYETVQIGEQCWFAENLRATNFANGDNIPFESEDEFYDAYSPGFNPPYFETSEEFEEAYATDPYSAIGLAAYTYYDENEQLLEVYGNLYNWGSVMDPRGLCPSGWHVSSFDDWSSLELHTGLPDSENEILVGSVGVADSVGLKLRSEDLWTSPGLDLYGFNAFPGGHTSNFSKYIEYSGTWWTSSWVNGYGPGFRLMYSNSWGPLGIERSASEGAFGYSVRCIQDSE